MAELVDALVSGTSFRKEVQVRFLFWAPIFNKSAVGKGLQRFVFYGGISFGRLKCLLLLDFLVFYPEKSPVIFADIL